MEYINPLGKDRVSRLLIRFSVPAIVGMMVNALYNVVDRIFIGNAKDIGSNGLAGITIGFPIMIILMSMGVLFGVGGATLFSIRLGQGRQREAKEALGNTFVLLTIAGLLFLILGQTFLIPILNFFGASSTVLPYAVEYMRVIFFGAVFQIVGVGLNNFIRADGNPKIAMLSMFLGAGLNTILDPIFIFALNMGMRGAALATIISQSVSCIWVVSYFLGDRSRNKLKLKYMKVKFHIFTRITSLGMPDFLLQLANSLLHILINKNLLLLGGDIAVSGMGIINSIQTLLVMPILGIKQGAQPIISFNYGAKKYSRVKKTTWLAIMAATGIVLSSYLATRFFPVQIISLFNREEDLLRFGTYAIRTWFLFFPFVGFQIIASNFFQAIGRSKVAMALTLTRQVILLIPAIIVFSKIWGLEGLLYARPFSDLFTAIITGISFYFAYKDLEKIGERDYLKNSRRQTKK